MTLELGLQHKAAFPFLPTWVTLKRLCVEQFLVHLIGIMGKAGLLDETLKRESWSQQEVGK